MSEYNSGIESLAGFSFQIKVFIAKLLELSDGQSLGYEIGDDVSKTDIPHINEWNGEIKSNSISSLFQVKRTKVDDDNARKVLFNWLLADNVNKYQLIVAPNYTVNDNYINKTNIDEIYNDIKKTKSSRSLYSKVYDKYKKNNNYDDFKNKIERIRNNYELLDNYSVDKEIYNGYANLFHKTKNEIQIYEKRLNEFIKQINHSILIQASSSKPFSMDYEQFIEKIESVCFSISSEFYERNYSIFKDTHALEINEEIKSKREYRQLSYCNLSKETIIDNLINELYYDDFRDHYLENGKNTVIHNIESEAEINYKESKINEENDTPKKIYIDTLKRKIDKINKMHSNGTYISLTKESDKRISWKEE